MKGVSFREYERIRVVPSVSSAEERAIAVDELEALHQLGDTLGCQLIEHVSNKIVRPRQYVGAIKLGARTLEFLPKIESDGKDAPAVVRQNLLQMLLVAYELDGMQAGTASLAEQSAGWLDLLIRLFCHALADEVRRGLVKRYRVEEDDLPTVKGRFLPHEQLRRNSIHRERSACEYDEFDENHALNQLLKVTLTRMLRAAGTTRTEQLVRELLPAFEEVSAVQPTSQWLEGITLDRMSQRYGFCVSLAKLFLRGQTTDLFTGHQTSFALMFDMNELFERYIGKEMRQALRPDGYVVKLQHAQHYLVRDTKTASRLFQLRPDIVVTTFGETCCIIDTKWKRLQAGERKLGVAQADLYQMLAYSERYDCNSILLLYPWEPANGDCKGVQRQFAFEEKQSKVTIAEVSLQDLTTVRAQLRNIFDASTLSLS